MIDAPPAAAACAAVGDNCWAGSGESRSADPSKLSLANETRQLAACFFSRGKPGRLHKLKLLSGLRRRSPRGQAPAGQFLRVGSMILHSGQHQPGAMYALSLKQPWAALVLFGLKTIEIRRWPTRLRGPILLHAAKVDDERDLGWRLLPDQARAAAEQRGGVIGRLELFECRCYRTVDEFMKDAAGHRIQAEWFVPPRMYGFVLRNPRPIALCPWPGNSRFFTVPLAQLADRRGLQASEVGGATP
jgi:hypothetical protein